MKNVIASLVLLGFLSFACAKNETHSSTGVVKKINAGGQVLVIDHDEFPGFMEAMVMPFELEDPKLAEGLAVGDKIEFTIEKIDGGWPVTAIKKTGSGAIKKEKAQDDHGHEDDHGHSHGSGSEHQH